MNAIYNDANDKNVAAYVIYVDEGNIACADPEFKEQMTAAELEHVFVQRALVIASGAYAVPTAMVPHDNSTAYATVTAGESTVYSKEYSAD